MYKLNFDFKYSQEIIDFRAVLKKKLTPLTNLLLNKKLWNILYYYKIIWIVTTKNIHTQEIIIETCMNLY